MQARRILMTRLALLAGLALAAGCAEQFDFKADAGAGADAGDATVTSFPGAALGKPCKTQPECRAGLTCKAATPGGAATCVAAAATPANGACLLSAECKAGLLCGWTGFCTPAGKSLVGGECSSSSDCAADLVCNLIGLSGVCEKPKATAGDLGATCKGSSDCMAGLSCSVGRKQCVPGSLTLNPDLYSGVECRDDAEAARPFQGIVDIPRAVTSAAVDTDFYSFPFPSDIHRKKDGTLDLSRHPKPGLGLIGFDSVDRVAAGLGLETGWGLTTAAYARFTRALDPKSLTTTGDAATVRLVNLTTGAPATITVKFQPKRNKYICGNWLYVHTRWSDLLEPNTPYALIVSNGVKAAPELKDASVPGQSADLKLLLADAAPTDAALKPAWDTFAKLRAHLKTSPVKADKVVAATVFTTNEPRAVTQGLEKAAAAALKPELVGAPVVCAAGTVSPCATPGLKAGTFDPRGCPASVAATHTEIHARMKVPRYQKGDRPYLDKGGEVNLVGGKPALVDYEEVCIAWTIPKKTMPAGGWPLVVFAHGTGGSFRSGADGMGAQLAALVADGGAQTPVATLGIDQPMHANRRGKDAAGKELDTDPGPLFYNFANPQAAKGNFYQGAADNFSLFRWAKEFNGSLAGQTVKFDKAKLMFMGHSQGGTTGPMFLPYQADLKGAVLSGCGGSLVFGLLGKKLPADASVGMRIALQEMAIDEYHPVLNLLQVFFEPSDPLLYAPLMHHKPIGKPLNLLHTYGLGDNFTPPATSRIFAAATRATLGLPTPVPAGFDLIDDLGMAKAPLPLKATAAGLTAVTVQAKNDGANSLFPSDAKSGYDGHFVAFRDKTANRQVLQFIATLVQGTGVVVAK